MADERGFWDRILEGVDLSDYDPREWSGEDIWNTISPFAISETGRGEDEAVAARNAAWAALDPAEKKRIIAERQATTISEPVKRTVSTAKPFMSVSRTDAPRSQATPMPTREDIISRLLASGRGEYPPRTAARTPSSMGLEFGDVKGLSPSNIRTTAARREAAALKNRIVEEEARKRRAFETAKLREEQREKDKAEFPHLQKSLTRKEPIKPRQKPTLRDVGDTSITRGKSMAALRDVAAKKKAREKAAEAKKKPVKKKVAVKAKGPKPFDIPEQATKKAVEPAAKKKVASDKSRFTLQGQSIEKSPETSAKMTATIPAKTPKKSEKGTLETGRKAHTVKSGQTLSGIAKQHGTTLKALLAANPKLKGRPNLIKVGEKIKIRGPLKKGTSPYKGMTKKEWEKITTASQKQREQRSARKKGGIVKKAGGGKMKQVGLHTAEMRSGGKDIHQPQSKIKKRIHQETTYAKKGGKVGKKKQGYKARKDESIAMRVKKKRTKKQLKASRSESYGKWGKGKGKGKINRSGAALVASSYD